MATKPIKEEDVYKPQPKPLRDAKGRLLPGQKSLNPGGRPKDMRTAQAKLWESIKKVEKKKKKKFLEHYIEQAYKDKAMAIALLRKIVPDLKAIEVDKDAKETFNIILQKFTGIEEDKSKDKKDD